VTTNDGDKKPEAMPGAGAPAGQVTVDWDESSMRSVWANACSVAGSGEEIIVLFGMNRGVGHSDRQEVTIQLADRIVMSPNVAKRFAALLNNVIKDYESRYGKLEV
jgi:hypothetical protein